MGGQFHYIAQQVLNALQLATFYVPLAMAFALIQAITKRVFLSFGDVTMFGSFAAVYFCFTRLLQGDDDLTAGFLALIVALFCAGGLGAGIAQLVIKPVLEKSAQAFMITSVGLSIILEEVMRLQSMGRDIWIPPLFQGEIVVLWVGPPSLQITAINLASIFLTIVTVIATLLGIKYSSFGRNWQACAQEIKLARLCGVNSDLVVQHTFMLGAALSATSGWIAAITYGGTSFSSGIMLGFKAMFAAVIGGFDSLRGAIFGAISLAAMEVLWSALFGTTYRDVGVFSFIVFVLLLRPEGLSGIAARRESEA